MEKRLAGMDLEAGGAAGEPFLQGRLWVKSPDPHGSKGS